MQDTLIGHFTDRDTASRAVQRLIDEGVSADRVATHTTVEAGWRGLGDPEDMEVVHGDKHSPRIRTDTERRDAMDVMVTVEVGDEAEQEELARLLRHLGATGTEVVEGTPPGIVER